MVGTDRYQYTLVVKGLMLFFLKSGCDLFELNLNYLTNV